MEENLEWKHPSFQKFIKGYTNETDVDYALINQIPWFIRIHKLFTFTKLLRTVDVVSLPEDPDWLKELRSKLINKIEHYRRSFETSHTNSAE